MSARFTFVIASLILVPACCATEHEASPVEAAAETPPAHTWAQPLERSGLPNLHRVGPELYRGAQPTAEGWEELEALGVKTVLSLRAFHRDHPPEDSALCFDRISFKTWHPEDEDVVRFLRFVNDPANQPVFVHCEHGADRTGTMSAIWRIVHDGWSREEALREMLEGEFEFHDWNQQLVRYVRKTDFGALARRAGMQPAPQQ